MYLAQNRLLEEIGWKVVPFSMKHSKNIKSEWSSYFVDEIEYGEIYSLWGKFVRISKILYSFEARNKLKNVLERVSPDICHLHNIYHHLSPSILGVLKEYSIPTVLTAHDLKLACPAYKMLAHDGICERCKNGRIYNVMIHRCIKDSAILSGIIMLEASLHKVLGSYTRNIDRIVVPSRFYLDKLVEWGWDSGRIIYIPNFVDVKLYKQNNCIGKAFVYFGRLAPEKGLGTLVKAAARAQVPVYIVGEGPYKKTLEELVSQLNAKVRFFGYLTGDDLHNVIRSGRATVLPSEWYENAPISLMESYALGRPVIGAKVGGIPELIREGYTGTMFESESVESLVDALRRIADTSDAQIEEMGRCGREWMNMDFSEERYRERLLELYAGLGVASPSINE